MERPAHLATLLACTSLLMCAKAGAGPPLRPITQIPLSPGTTHNARTPLGTNLSGLVDYSSELVFADAFLSSRSWISSSPTQWDDRRAVDVDEHGWVRSLKPNQWARTVLLWDLGAAVPAGDYVITYDGIGELVAEPHPVVENAAGRIVVRLDPKRGGMTLIIKSTDANSPLKNIRVWMPGTANQDTRQVFYPAFVDSVRNYKVLRFMEAGATNHSKLSKWTDRPQLTDARYDAGVPLELMADLANAVRADAWVNVPHLADDAYVEGMARVLAARLDRDRLLYVEYSNEVWNGIFGQASYAREQGKRLGLDRSEYTAQLRYYAMRSVQVFRIFERVLGDKKRLVRVMASQAANPWVSETVLSFQDAYKDVDALAIAPYFGGGFGAPEHRARVRTMTLDQLMTALKTESIEEARGWMRAQSAIARTYGVPLIAYEGGQHLAGVGPSVDDPTINALFDAANRDPRMKDLYAVYLKAWKDEGGQLFVHFVNTSVPTKWGRWGARESLTQSRASAPKLDAVLTFSEQNPIWWHAQ